ncbi:polysaccharide deacetylase family protein [Thermoclostridium stercorarium]|uniref:polysaccharide deacetylase family protein n=1 Tax=Thermoclostridium stercorarium TaxID=1510 RepID=UPI0022495CAF|nr:polysaccharide deacetylase family protein [Thermoclostridium stercorarium]UZQ86886.1 polysaccharide deacetylase family protein [Thermoclostridium stercorarium]
MIVIRRRTIAIFFVSLVLCLMMFLTVNGKIIEVSAPVREIPIYSVENSEGKVSITFDCAWGAQDIPEILRILKEKNVKATFFVVGEWARRNPEETKMIAEQGHELANHSENHFKMSVLSKDKIKKEIMDCSKTIEEISGVKTDLFRAPYGDYNDTVISIARQNGYFTIQWSIDSLDWKPGITQEAIFERVSKVSSGDILLFHNDTSHTAKILGKVIDIIKEKGLKPVPVSELILKDNFEIRHDGRQIPAGKKQ